MPNSDYESRLMRQGARWAGPPATAAYRETLAQLRQAELTYEDCRRTLAKAMATTRRNTAGLAQLRLLAGRAQRAKATLQGLRAVCQALGA